MTKKNTKVAANKTIETLTHGEATRKNIPTAEYQSVMQKGEQRAVRVAYDRRNRDLDPQLVWRGKDEQDWSDLVVHAPPLYIQEKVHPKALIDELLREAREREHEAGEITADLFSDFNGIPKDADKTEFYHHDQNWSNRMILGDSLQVMASLAEREGLRGKVQCIYFDPPYGIKFNSNFQWSTTTRDVKDGKIDQITREPEQVKAFRDTWRDGIHSYLTHALARLIDDKAVRTGDLRAFLGKDFPPESLPSVDEAIALVERHRAAIDKDVSEDERATALQSLKAEQAARRQELLRERQSLDARQQREASRLTGQHRDARVALRRGYLEQRRRIHQQRHENRPTGLAAFLGRVTGVEALRALLHRRQDAKAFKAYREQLAGLLIAQTRERRALAQRHLAEVTEQARREKALTRVDRREVVALLRDLRTAQRVLNRGDSEGRMPSLALVAAKARRTPAPAVDRAPVHRVGDLRVAFEDAVTRSPNELPDVLSAFARAAQRQRRERETADDKAPALDRMARPPLGQQPMPASPERGPEPGRDRE